MESSYPIEISTFDQELTVLLKKLLYNYKIKNDKTTKTAINDLLSFYSNKPKDKPTDIEGVFKNHFDSFRLSFLKQDKKVDLLIFEFFEKIMKFGLIKLNHRIEGESKKGEDKKTMADFFIGEVCRMFEYKDYKLTQRLVKFVVGFIIENKNEINSLTLNKITCNCLITYFEAKGSFNNGRFVDYIDTSLDSMILFLVNDIELHDKVVKKGSRKNPELKKIGFLQNDRVFCRLIIDDVFNSLFKTEESKKEPLTPNFLRADEEGENAFDKVNCFRDGKGRFGDCFICSSPADYYCVTQKLSVCGVECKFRIKQLTSPILKCDPNKVSLVLVMLKYFMKLSSKRNISMNLEFKKYVLSKIKLIYKRAGFLFLSDGRTVKRTNDFLVSEIVNNLCLEDSQVFGVSIGIFNEIVTKYRKTFKREIGVVFKQLLLNLIKKKEVNQECKLSILKSIEMVIFNKKVFADFYLNYDLNEYESFGVGDFFNLIVKQFQDNKTNEEETQSKLRIKCVEITQNFIDAIYDNLNEDNKFVNSYLTYVRSENKKDIEGFVRPGLISHIESQTSKREKTTEIIKEFNVKPKTILKQKTTLQSLLPAVKTFEEKLAFLFYNHPTASKDKLGKFFGSDQEQNQKILALFFDYENYKGSRIDQAMSSFMTKFNLPSEGQQIDRILQRFSKRFSTENKSSISEESAYGLSFLVMMLQSEWHNPQVTEKMSYEQFMKLGMNIKDFHKYLKEEAMREIFDRVTRIPLGSYKEGQNHDMSFSELNKKTVRRYNAKVIYTSKEFSVKGEKEYSFVGLEFFRRELADGLVVFVSMGYEAAKDLENYKALSRTIQKLFHVFIRLRDKTNVERLFLAVARLTGLDKRGRPVTEKNLIILHDFLDLARHNCDSFNSVCLSLLFDVLINTKFYILPPSPYDGVTRKNNHNALTGEDTKGSLEKFIHAFFERASDQLKIYQTLSLFFETVNSYIEEEKLLPVMMGLLGELFDYTAYVFDVETKESVSQSFYNVIVSNALNTVSNLQASGAKEGGRKELLLFIIEELSSLIKAYFNSVKKDFNFFKPFDMLLLNLRGRLKR